MTETFNQWHVELFKQNVLKDRIENQILKDRLLQFIDIHFKFPKQYSVLIARWVYAYIGHQLNNQLLTHPEDARLIAANQYWFAEHFNSQGDEFKSTSENLYRCTVHSLTAIKSKTWAPSDFINTVFYLRRALAASTTQSKDHVRLYLTLFKMMKECFGVVESPVNVHESKNDLQNGYNCFLENKVDDSEWQNILNYANLLKSNLTPSQNTLGLIAEIFYIAILCFEQIRQPNENDKFIYNSLKKAFCKVLPKSNDHSPRLIPLYQKSLSFLEEQKTSDVNNTLLLVQHKYWLLKKEKDNPAKAQEIIYLLSEMKEHSSVDILIDCYDLLIRSEPDKLQSHLERKLELIEKHHSCPEKDEKFADTYTALAMLIKETKPKQAKLYLSNAIKLIKFDKLQGQPLLNYLQMLLAIYQLPSKKTLSDLQELATRFGELFRWIQHPLIKKSIENVYNQTEIILHQHLIKVSNDLTKFVKPDNSAKLRLAKLHCSLGDCIIDDNQPHELVNVQYENALNLLLTVNKMHIRTEIRDYVATLDKLCSKFLMKFLIDFSKAKKEIVKQIKNPYVPNATIHNKAYDFTLICLAQINYLLKHASTQSASLVLIYKCMCICEFHLTVLSYSKNDLDKVRKHAGDFKLAHAELVKQPIVQTEEVKAEYLQLYSMAETITQMIAETVPVPDPTHSLSLLTNDNSELTLEDEPSIEPELNPEQIARIKLEEEQKQIAEEELKREKFEKDKATELKVLKTQLTQFISELRHIKNSIIDRLTSIKNLFPKRLDAILSRNTAEDKELAKSLEDELSEYESSLSELENYLSNVSKATVNDLNRIHPILSAIIVFNKEYQLLLDESLPDFNLRTKEAAAPKDEIIRINRTTLVRDLNQARRDAAIAKKRQLEEKIKSDKETREKHKIDRKAIIAENKRLAAESSELTDPTPSETKTTSTEESVNIALFWEKAISTVVNMQQLLEISRQTVDSALSATPNFPGHKEMIIHFALLYNILQFSRFRYRKSEIERDQLVDLRNMLIHHGAYQLADFKTHAQTVLDAASSFCPSLRVDIELYFNKRKGFVSQYAGDKQAQLELKELSVKGSLPDMELVQFLQKFHISDTTKTQYSDMKEKDRRTKVFTLIPLIQSIHNVLKEAKERPESEEFQLRFMPHIQALKMLFTMCGEIHPIPKNRLECKNDYIRFCAHCKVIRDWEGHVFKEFSIKDVLKTAAIADQFQIRKPKLTQPVTIGAGMEPTAYRLPPGFSYESAALMFASHHAEPATNDLYVAQLHSGI